MNNEDKKNLLGVLTKFDWIWGRVRISESKYVYVSFVHVLVQNCVTFLIWGGDKWISEKEKKSISTKSY